MTLGVLGTMVWDRIEHPDDEVVERWGGITYSLAAAAAALPDGWTVRPIIRLGRDLADEAHAFLDSVPGLEPSAVVVVDEPNNRVHLRYRDRHHRDEYLSGGVSGWAWRELEPRLRGLDGLFVNLISGFELDADLAARLGRTFQGPRYVDIHSLVLDVADDGHRVPRPRVRRDAWFQAFDVVQLNDRELALIAGDDDPAAVAEGAVRTGTAAVLVTRGPDGARWVARGDGPVWPAEDGVVEDRAERGAPIGPGADAVTGGTVAVDGAWTRGDPTGCGDVWGATCFVALVRGRRLSEAMDAANRAAARNVDHRGADGLYEHLRTSP